jgi:hypothetical protein
MCFSTFKVREKYIWTRVNFWIRVDFGFFGSCFFGFLKPYISLLRFL